MIPLESDTAPSSAPTAPAVTSTTISPRKNLHHITTSHTVVSSVCIRVHLWFVLFRISPADCTAPPPRSRTDHIPAQSLAPCSNPVRSPPFPVADRPHSPAATPAPSPPRTISH